MPTPFRPCSISACLWLSGCGGDLPLVERIASLRPLAVRAVVQDAGADPEAPARAEAMPFETVRLHPLFMDPNGFWSEERIVDELDPIWLACVLAPTQGLGGCVLEARPLAVADVPVCPPPMVGPIDPTMPPSIPSPCQIETDSPSSPRYQVPLDGAFLLGSDVEVTMVAHAPDADVDTDDCLAVLLADNGDPDAGCIFVVQRVSVGPDGDLIALASQFGVPDSALPAKPEPVPDPDTHPRIASIKLAAYADESDDSLVGTFTPSDGDELELPWGTRLEVEIEAPTTDLQTYAVPNDDGTYVARQETYAGRWFRTWGDLLGPDSNDPKAINTWTLARGAQDEDDLPPMASDGAARARLVYVLRDDRQGVTWTSISIRVTGGPPMQ